MQTRRSFLRDSSLLAAGALAGVESLKTLAMKKGIKNIGIQLFTLPKLVDEGFDKAMQTLAKAGFKEVEFFGPYPYSPEQSIEGWKPLAAQLGLKQNAYYGKSPAEVRKTLDDNGLSSPSMHADILTIRQRLEQAAEAAQVLGQRYIIVPALMGEIPGDIDGYKRLAEEFNKIGRRAKELGVRFGYHNHGYEQAEMNGRIPLEVLLEETDPQLVAFEMDIFWMIAGGGDPVYFLNKYPKRFQLMHLKDMKEQKRFPGRGDNPMEWMGLFPNMTDLGDGVLKLDEILGAAQRSGVKHFLVERDLTPDPARTLESSYKFLSTVKRKK